MTASPQLLAALERYYDEVPRASATAEEHGPFTLFLKAGEGGWPFYARPTLGGSGQFTPDDVRRVRARQREAGAPEAFEWVGETTPELASVARAGGLVVGEYPLLVLADARELSARPPGVEVRMLEADDPDLGRVNSAVGAAFRESDDPEPPAADGDLRNRLAGGTFRLAGAFDAHGPVGGGSHSPRGRVTELTGIGVVPRARRLGVGAAVTAALVEDARTLGVETVFLSAGSPRVADLYASVGFEPVATACIATPPSAAG